MIQRTASGGSQPVPLLKRCARTAVSVVSALLVAGHASSSDRLSAGGATPSWSRVDAAISGFVFDAVTKDRLPGALVALNAPGIAQRLQRADAQGRFVFAELAPGRYFLTAAHAGYADGGYGTPSLTSRSGVIIVEDGGWFRSAAIGLLPLATVAGRVMDGNGSEVAGAHVRVLRRYVAGDRVIVAAGAPVSTDDRGQYLLSGLEPGSYHVQAVPPGRTQAQALYPSAVEVSSALQIDLAAGENRQAVNIQLQAGGALHVAGHVDRPDLMRGSLLRLVPRGLETAGAGVEVASATADSAGRFEFREVPPGRYTLIGGPAVFGLSLTRAALYRGDTDGPSGGPTARWSRSTGGLPALPGARYESYAPPIVSDAPAGFVNTELDVTADLENLVVPVEQAGAIAFRVDLRDVTNFRSAGSLEVTPADGGLTGGGSRSRLGEGDLLVSTSPLAPGNYAVRVFGLPVVIARITSNGQDLTRGTIPVTAGGITDVQLTLSGRVPRVSGVIRGEDGQAVPGAAALLFPVDSRLWDLHGFMPTWIRLSPGSSDGRFELSEVRPGSYYLAAVSSDEADSWAQATFLQRLIPSAETVHIALGDAAVRDITYVPRRTDGGSR